VHKTRVPQSLVPRSITLLSLIHLFISSCGHVLWKKGLTSLTLSLRCRATGSLSSPPTIIGSLFAGAGGTVTKTISSLCNDEELLVRTRDSPISGFSRVFCCWYSSLIFAWKFASISRCVPRSSQMAQSRNVTRAFELTRSSLTRSTDGLAEMHWRARCRVLIIEIQIS